MASKRPIEIVLNSEYKDKDINRAIADLNSLKRQAGGTTPVMGGLGKAFAGMAAGLAGFFAVGKIVDFFQESAKAAIEDEASVKRLEVAMRNLNMTAELPGVEAGIDRLSRQLGIADDELRPAFQRLAQATGDASTAQSALQTALDISAGSGKDLNTVTLALAKAYTGNAGALKRMGVPLDDNIVKSRDMNAIQGELNRVFGGQATAAAQTYGGQMRRLTVAVDEAKEAIGYALLQSIEQVSDALGGPEGAIDAVDNFGIQMANIVRGAGDWTTSIVNAGVAVRQWAVDLGMTEEQVSNVANTVKEWVLWLNPAVNAVEAWRQRGEELDSTNGVLNSTLADSQAATKAVADASARAAAATESLSDAFAEINATVGSTSALLAFRKSVNEIGDALKESGTDITGFSDKAIANKQMILSVFTDAANAAQKWGDANGKTQDEVLKRYQQFARNARRELINNGVDQNALDKFLGDNDLWYSTAARNGRSLGLGFADGTIMGIAVSQAAVNNQARRMVREAEQAARAAAESKSPSKLFARLGKDLVKGTIQGVRDEIRNRRSELNSLYQAWFNESVASKEQAVADAEKARDSYNTSIVQPLKDNLKNAEDALKDYKRNVEQSIAGGINWGQLAPTADVFDKDGALEKPATTFIENLKAKAQAAVAFATKVKQLITLGLSEAGISQVLAAGQEAGTAIADELIAGGASAITETNDLMTAVSTAASSTAAAGGAAFYQSGVDLAASQLAGALNIDGFYQAGVDNAQAALDGFNATYGPGSTGFGKFFDQAPTFAEFTEAAADFKDFKKDAKKLIKKKQNKKAKGKAGGGPVSPDTAYFVGEEGPELFVPQTMGSIIPAGQSGGNTYQIKIEAGVGDPRQIGQTVVEYIKRFEKANGPVFAKAG